MPDSDDNLQLEIGHVLFIDIVGYSKLLIEEQTERLNQLTQIVLATSQVRESTDERVIRLPTGDGMALVFRHSAEEPARCALEIAEALRKHPELPVRMGIHSGPVSEVTDVSGRTNIAGAGINLAQRVMDCGDAGHILLSQHVADDLMQYRQWAPRLRDLGDCEVKHGVRLHLVNLYAEPLGNPEPPERFRQVAPAVSAPPPVVTTKRVPWRALIAVAVLLALACGAGLFFFRQRTTPRTSAPIAGTAPLVPEKSIAVLPFENLSDDKANAYFADGIQDEILTRLSKIADLKVISRTSTQHYQSAPDNLPEIARQLGVANVVEGSVQKSGDAVRVNVQLIKAANDSHLWADTFDRKLTDIFSVESEVAKTIADQLRARLTGQEEQVIAAKPTDQPAAYDAYLRGLAYSLRTSFSAESLLNAQRYLRESVRLDPNFARAWALLSSVDSEGYITTFLQPTPALRDEARQSAETALRLQPDLGEGLLARGFFYYACLGDFDTAERYLEQARRVLPNSSELPQLLAYVARRRGQWDQSESYFKEAERLDPRNVNLLAQHAFSFTHRRQFDEAERLLEQILDIAPDDLDTIATQAAIAQVQGDLPRASTLLASLHPPATDAIALERQVYQAILERRPAGVIPKLQEVLAHPDPTLGYFNGELRFWLGWAQNIAGDQAAARQSWQAARTEMESILRDQPKNHFLIGDLALITMSLGDKAGAFSLAERCLQVDPVEKDAVAGPQSLEVFARIAPALGEPDRAIEAIGRLLSMPHSGLLDRSLPFTPALLRLDPMFDPLRNDPRFQKLCAEKQP